MKKITTTFIFCMLLLATKAQLTKEQEGIKQVFFNFLKFYQKNEAKFNSFKLYKGKGVDNTPPYKVQWKEVEKYFAYLRKNVAYVGEAYIVAERNHFKYSDSCFKADPTEEIAAGFDYDRWAGGQESIEYTIKYYASAKNKYIVTIKGNTAQLKIGEKQPEDKEEDRMWSFVPFVKEGGKWKMADNIYPLD
jgi:hypothetical protein